ncbi:DUF6328 family protein [Arthrobacter sp. H14]|uniref:DUF6328 family protein n=1 Tax=Arthrobacter sp. H14 TaxID=1312959 RepID=UPI0004AC951C|nr:DUF6328 family protein [Arthrobacter sp. H14]
MMNVHGAAPGAGSMSGQGGAAGAVTGGISDDGRGESENQRLDRNWVELLQELRVMQTGIQILTGFLLTLPFHAKFEQLDAFQVTVYLCLVTTAAIVTALILTSVNLHRALFGRHIKKSLVTNSDRMVRVTMALVAFVLAGTAGFIFDIVIGRFAGFLMFGILLGVVIILWVIYPFIVRRRATREQAGAGTQTG